MSLLRLSNVTLHRPNDEDLSDVSLAVEQGERIAIRGARHAGKTSLLHVAAGVLSPDAGVVEFDGRAPAKALGRHGGIGIAHDRWPRDLADTLVEQVAKPLTRSLTPQRAQARARELLRSTGVQPTTQRPDELDRATLVRAAIARAVILQPRLLVVDEPTRGLAADDSDATLELLHRLTGEGLAVLMTSESAGAFKGARAYSLRRGRLIGPPERTPADVLPLRRAQ